MKSTLLALIMFCFASAGWAKTIWLDVRTPEEYSQEHIPEAVNIDVKNSSFKADVSKLSHDDTYKVYCRSGKRSAQAISIMKELGFKHLENLGGLEGAKKVYPTVQ